MAIKSVLCRVISGTAEKIFISVGFKNIAITERAMPLPKKRERDGAASLSGK